MINFIIGLIGWCFSFIFQSWFWPFAIFCSLWNWGLIGKIIALLVAIGSGALFFGVLEDDDGFGILLFLLIGLPIGIGIGSFIFTGGSFYNSIALEYSGFWGWTFHTLGFLGLFYSILFLESGSSSSGSRSSQTSLSAPESKVRQEFSYPSEPNIRRRNLSVSETSAKRRSPSIQELNSHSFPSLDDDQLNEIEKNVKKVQAADSNKKLKPSDYDDFDLLNEMFPTVESKLARYKYLVYRKDDISKLNEYRDLSLKFLKFIIRESSSKDKEIFKQYIQYRLLPNAKIAKGWNKESDKFSDKAIYWPHRQECFEQALFILSKSKR